MAWTRKNYGKRPPSSVTWETWIACSIPSTTMSGCNSATNMDYKAESMWSPRRGHAAVARKSGETIFVLGGRAREHVRLPEQRSVGGILGMPVENDPFNSAWREASVLKNDVWLSNDEGVTWTMANAGCHDPQEELILAGQPYVDTKVPQNVKVTQYEDGRVYHGTAAASCETDADCYPQLAPSPGRCKQLGDAKTCVCNMWSPREHHSAAIMGNYIYVTGGFASVRRRNCGDYSCGDVDAGSYRQYMNDVWRSTTSGRTWESRTQEAFGEDGGRGAHVTLEMNGKLWTMFGQGGKTDTAKVRINAAFVHERLLFAGT